MVVIQAVSTAAMGTPAPIATTVPPPSAVSGAGAGKPISSARSRSWCCHSRFFWRCTSKMIVGTRTSGIMMPAKGMIRLFVHRFTLSERSWVGWVQPTEKLKHHGGLHPPYE